MKESDLWYIFFCLCPCFRDATHYSSWWPLSMRNKVKGKNVFWLPPKQEVGEILQRKHMFLLLLSNMGISLTPQWIFPVGHRKQKINLIGLFVHSPFPTLYLKIIWLYMHLKNNLQAFIIGKYVVHNYLRRSKTIPCLVFFFCLMSPVILYASLPARHTDPQDTSLLCRGPAHPPSFPIDMQHAGLHQI